MDWLTIAGLGACGGAIVSVLTFSSDVLNWQEARRIALARPRAKLPKLNKFVDPYADLLALLTRVALGALAGGVFHAQVRGVEAAIAVGMSAPALLTQFGRIRSGKTLAGSEGTGLVPNASIRVTDATSHLPEEG